MSLGSSPSKFHFSKALGAGRVPEFVARMLIIEIYMSLTISYQNVEHFGIVFIRTVLRDSRKNEDIRGNSLKFAGGVQEKGFRAVDLLNELLGWKK